MNKQETLNELTPSYKKSSTKETLEEDFKKIRKKYLRLITPSQKYKVQGTTPVKAMSQGELKFEISKIKKSILDLNKEKRISKHSQEAEKKGNTKTWIR